MDMANSSLLKQREQWKQKIQTINRIISNVTDICGITDPEELKTATKPWREHWDYQLFKVMECQYRMGLESLNE